MSSTPVRGRRSELSNQEERPPGALAAVRNLSERRAEKAVQSSPGSAAFRCGCAGRGIRPDQQRILCGSARSLLDRPSESGRVLPGGGGFLPRLWLGLQVILLNLVEELAAADAQHACG